MTQLCKDQQKHNMLSKCAHGILKQCQHVASVNITYLSVNFKAKSTQKTVKNCNRELGNYMITIEMSLNAYYIQTSTAYSSQILQSY